MSCVAAPIVMHARKATQVVAVATMPRSLTPQAQDWGATLAGQGFASELLRCSACKWNNHTLRLAPCISSRKASVAAMSDLFRGSLKTDLQAFKVTSPYCYPRLAHDWVIKNITIFQGQAL